MLNHGLPPLVIPSSAFNSWQTEPSLEAWPVPASVDTSEPLLPTPQVVPPVGAVIDERVVAAQRDFAPVPSETVQFRRSADEALQLLPGRLEVLAGLSQPREIRFVRIPGEPARVILGREPGQPPHHVTLQSSTVSRQHARLDFTAGRWAITNLSRTNPVIVNDDALSVVDGERALTEGDRIELGEVVLKFCSH